MLDSAIPHGRLSPGKGKEVCSASALVPLNTWLLQKLLEQAAGSMEARRWQPPVQPTAQLAFCPPVCSACERALSVSTLHGSSVVSTTSTTGLLLGYLVMGEDGLTQAWHPFWRHLTREEPASQPRVSHCREAASVSPVSVDHRRKGTLLLPHFWPMCLERYLQMNMILNCF